jgi:hypothetical protein
VIQIWLRAQAKRSPPRALPPSRRHRVDRLGGDRGARAAGTWFALVLALFALGVLAGRDRR